MPPAHSEDNANSQLQNPGIGCIADDTESRSAQGAAGQAEVGVIESIESLGTELHEARLGQIEILQQRKIEVHSAIGAQYSAAGGSERERLRNGKRRGVKPSLGGSFRGGQAGVTQQVGPLRSG